MHKQVTRVVKVELGEGEAEVVLKNLSKSLDKDSVRVDGIGPASVTEVSFQVSWNYCDYSHNLKTSVSFLNKSALHLYVQNHVIRTSFFHFSISPFPSSPSLLTLLPLPTPPISPPLTSQEIVVTQEEECQHYL